MRKVVSANPKAATEIQPCCKERTANQILASVVIPAMSMLKMGVRFAMAKRIAAAHTSASPVSTFAARWRARTAPQRRQSAASPCLKGIARYTASQSRQMSIGFTGAARSTYQDSHHASPDPQAGADHAWRTVSRHRSVSRLDEVLADHFEHIARLSMH